MLLREENIVVEDREKGGPMPRKAEGFSAARQNPGRKGICLLSSDDKKGGQEKNKDGQDFNVSYPQQRVGIFKVLV